MPGAASLPADGEDRAARLPGRGRRCRAAVVQRPARHSGLGWKAREFHRGRCARLGGTRAGHEPGPQVGDPARRGRGAGWLRGPVRTRAGNRARARGARGRSGGVGKGGRPRGGAPGLPACLQGPRRPSHPRGDPGYEPCCAEGRDASRLCARGRDAQGDPPRRRGRGQRGLGLVARGVRRLGGRAELIDDRGTAAESDDFFRSRAFYDAEGVSHTLRVEGAGHAVAMPVLVREIGEDGLVDAITPYGYPGAVLGDGTPPDPAELDWSATGLVSLFARDRLAYEPCFAGATQRSVVQVHDPSRERTIRSRFGDQIRRNKKLGYRIEILPGPTTSVEQRLSFHGAYSQTMRRADAAESYYFAP